MKMLTLWACLDERPATGQLPKQSALAWKDAWQGGNTAKAPAAPPADENAAPRHPVT